MESIADLKPDERKVIFDNVVKVVKKVTIDLGSSFAPVDKDALNNFIKAFKTNKAERLRKETSNNASKFLATTTATSTDKSPVSEPTR